MVLEVIRQMDNLGRVCIPKDFRKSFDITKDTKLLFVMTRDGILLKKIKIQITEDEERL